MIPKVHTLKGPHLFLVFGGEHPAVLHVLQESSLLAIKFSGPLAVLPALVSQALSRNASSVSADSKKREQQSSQTSSTSQPLCAVNPSPLAGIAAMLQHESQLVW
jgi:hypothetical protein